MNDVLPVPGVGPISKSPFGMRPRGFCTSQPMHFRM